MLFDLACCRKALVNSRTVEHAEEVRRHKARRLLPRGARVDLWLLHFFRATATEKEIHLLFICLADKQKTEYLFNYQLIRDLYIYV